MSTYLTKANLALVLILVISLCLSGNVNAAPESSDVYRAAFTKKSPSNLAAGINPTNAKLEWNAASNVFRYVYCYYSYDITYNVCDIDDKSTWKSNGTSTSVLLPTLLSGKTYYWQVGAKLNDNSFIYADGALSSKWSFATGSGSGGVGAGVYDDTHSNWVYTGKWAAATYTGTETGPYQKTYKESRNVPDYATFTFAGGRAALYYTPDPDNGIMFIYLDHSTTPIYILDQSSPLTPTWQKQWLSPALTTGTHTIKLVYATGNSVNIDAIQIFPQADTTPPGPIALTAAPGTNAGTVRLSWQAVGDDGNTGAASSYLVRYSINPFVNEGDWTAATPVTKGVPTPKAAGQPESMVVKGLDPGTTYHFAVRAQDEQANIGNLTSDSAIAYEPPPAPIGVYDDRVPQWNYSADWLLSDLTGPYHDTLQYSNTIGAFAEFTFDGSQFILAYTGYTNRGTLNVIIDGNPAGTINEYSATRAWQAKWFSGDLGAGPHTVRLEHASGAMVDIDAIEIRTYIPPPGLGTWDDTHPNWVYSSDFLTFTDANTYGGSAHYSKTIGQSAEFTFVGAQFEVIYTGYTNRGTLDVFIDGNPTKAATINEYSATRAWQARWASGDLGAGQHTVRLVHASGAMVDIDGIEIKAYTPPGTGTWDDTHPNWVYDPGYLTFTNANAYGGSAHYSNTIGTSAEFTFVGSRFDLIFTGYTNRGTLEVSVDGVPVGTINQYRTTRVWQAKWSSGDLGPGQHTVTLEHATGAIVDIDAIKTYTALGLGTWDDTDPTWAYGNGYLTSTGVNTYGGSAHYSNTVGTSAEFTIDGTQFVLIYTGNTNRGKLDVFIDGSLIKVDTIDQYSASRAWQARWASGDLGAGQHTVKLVHASGATVEIDGIEVKMYAPPPTATKYDDADGGWTYSGFTATTSTGPYLDTFRYSTAVGSTAEFDFTGSRITIIYSENSNRGDLEVYIDGNPTPVATINQYNATRVWQASWTSGDLGPGPHTVRLVHAAGATVDIDAIEVLSP
ncbi:MAG: hypothetical protein JW730_04125 [Anaerolineales bacterium]|nr:hypothetical protein [Anaerolineales bacterium]